MKKDEFIEYCVSIFACNKKLAETYVKRNNKEDYTEEDVLKAHYMLNTTDKHHGKWHTLLNGGRTTKRFMPVEKE